MTCTAHGISMHDYLTPTAILFHRPEQTLTNHERSSLNSLMACVDDMDGYRRRSPAHRWAGSARRIEKLARHAGDLSAAVGDLSNAQRQWIAAQRKGPLDSFQRDRLEAIPGWTWGPA